MTRRWSFDIEITAAEPVCDGHYSTVEHGASLLRHPSDLFAFASSVKWCSDGRRTRLIGPADGTRFLFPDGMDLHNALTVPLETAG